MMRQSPVPAVLTLIALAVAACGGDGAQPTPAPTDTSTPGPVQEWTVEEVRVDGSTITVHLRVFAGIDVGVTLDGGRPDETVASPPVLEFVFRDVSPGEHAVEVSDVVGFKERIGVIVVPDDAPAGPLDTALAEVSVLTVEDGAATIRVEEIRVYNRYPNATYPRLEVSSEIEVAVQDAATGRLRAGEMYVAALSFCREGEVGGLTCDREGWTGAFYALDQGAR